MSQITNDVLINQAGLTEDAL